MARTTTKTTTDEAKTAAPKQAVAVLQPSRMPIAPQVGTEYGITPMQWRVLVDQIFPGARTVEAVLMALEYCRRRNLDIFKRPVHIVPMWSTAKRAMVETVWPGVSEIRTTAHRTGSYAGMDPMRFGDDVTVKFSGEIEVWEDNVKRRQTVTRDVIFPEWCEITVYRIVHGTRVPYTLRTYWEECYGSTGKSEVPNDMWCKRPRGQLMKCAEVAVLRMAFPEEIGNEYAAEEMEGKILDLAPNVPQPSSPPPSLKKEEPKAEPETDKQPYVDVANFLTTIDESLSFGMDEATQIDLWDNLFVETTLAGNDEALEKAFAIRKRHAERIDTTGEEPKKEKSYD